MMITLPLVQWLQKTLIESINKAGLPIESKSIKITGWQKEQI
jgi:hypothetical protein